MTRASPQVSPSATNVTYTHQGFKTAFRVMANDAQQGKVLGDYAVTKLGAKNRSHHRRSSAYGQELADEFEKGRQGAGADQIVTREFTGTDQTDFNAILTSIKGKNPDLIFYGGMDSQSGPMMKQIKNLGLTSKFLTGDGGQNAEFVKLAGEAGEGAYASSPGVPLEKMPGGKSFRRKVQGQVQHRDPALRALRLRLHERACWRRDEEGRLQRPAKYLPALAGITYQGVTVGTIVLRRKRRHQGRQHQPVPGQGRQVGVSPRQSAADRVAFPCLNPRFVHVASGSSTGGSQVILERRLKAPFLS